MSRGAHRAAVRHGEPMRPRFARLLGAMDFHRGDAGRASRRHVAGRNAAAISASGAATNVSTSLAATANRKDLGECDFRPQPPRGRRWRPSPRARPPAASPAPGWRRRGGRRAPSESRSLRASARRCSGAGRRRPPLPERLQAPRSLRRVRRRSGARRRWRIGQWPEQHAVDDAEHRRVGADAEREHDHHRGREAGAAAQPANRVAHVASQSVQPVRPRHRVTRSAWRRVGTRSVGGMSAQVHPMTLRRIAGHEEDFVDAFLDRDVQVGLRLQVPNQ